MTERKGVITMKGEGLTLIGSEAKEGDAAPEFIAVKTDLSPFVFRTDCRDKVCVIVSVPSLDTSVCSIEARRFDAESQKLGDGAKVVIISMDLPFAQTRWRLESGVSRIELVSDHVDAAFGKSYGVLIKGLRLLARTVFVVDREGVIRYREVVSEVTEEPDYDRAIEAALALK